MSGTKEISKLKKCPNGHPVTDDMNYCPMCGVEIAAIGLRFCPKCGVRRQPSDEFCTHCGFPLEKKPMEEKNDDFSFFGFFWID